MFRRIVGARASNAVCFDMLSRFLGARVSNVGGFDKTGVFGASLPNAGGLDKLSRLLGRGAERRRA